MCNVKGKLRDSVGIAKILLQSQKFDIGNTFGIIVNVDNKTVENMTSQYRLRAIQKKIFKMADIIDCSFNCMSVENSKGEFDIEFRSTPTYGNLNVRQLAVKYGGGGHYSAAGCNLSVNEENVGKDIHSLIINDVKDMYEKQDSKTEIINQTDIDRQLALILNETERLTKKVTPSILEKVDDLYKKGANYDYLFKKLKTFEKFMLENEILSRVPDSVLMYQNPRVNITLKPEDINLLCQKYNVTEQDILSAIDVFSDINIESALIKLPNGKKTQIDRNGNIKIQQINNSVKEVDYKI